MKILRHTLIFIALIIIIVILFRRNIYRQIITYKSISERTIYEATNKEFLNYIDRETTLKQDVEIEKLIKNCLSITSDHLNFTSGQNDTDPNKLFNTKTAHCIGYASFLAAACNYLIQKNELKDIWIAKPQIGQVYLFKTNIHNYFSTPFFKDHDFVIIENLNTGEKYAVDPSMHDYLRIDFITI